MKNNKKIKRKKLLFIIHPSSIHSNIITGPNKTSIQLYEQLNGICACSIASLMHFQTCHFAICSHWLICIAPSVTNLAHSSIAGLELLFCKFDFHLWFELIMVKWLLSGESQTNEKRVFLVPFTWLGPTFDITTILSILRSAYIATIYELYVALPVLWSPFVGPSCSLVVWTHALCFNCRRCTILMIWSMDIFLSVYT